MDSIEKFREISKHSKIYNITKLIHPKTNKVIESFSIQEPGFKKGNSVPIHARGIFIQPEDNKIIVRGYNKFFNINEIRQTKWENIKSNTVGPYELTLKENGCIIFVSVYNDDLFVTSKHSFTHLNTEGETIISPYSEQGEKWLYKYIGDKKNELIEFIKDNNITLIFELVDNDFEEHVLEYSKEENGLYLHGINVNTVEFKTWPSERVTEVAKRFNLIPVHYKIYDNIDELKEFAESCKGYYNGKAIEGWVIRCKKTDDETFFFKFKYDEPYLLYREWREATNAFLENRRWNHYRYTETYNYMKWVKEKYITDPKLFSTYREKKGIINIRKLYQEETKKTEYKPKFENPCTKENALFKLILPVGIPAVGKSTVARMLKILYNIGHVQAKKIEKKRINTDYINDVCKEFYTKTIVMADSCNSQKSHRKNLCGLLRNYYGNTLWIEAIRWDIKSPSQREILEFTRDRIEKRGENNELITPEKTSNYPIVIKSCLNYFEDIDLNSSEDKYINDIVDVKLKESSISIVKKLITALDLEPKTDEELKNAYEEANQIIVENYQPEKNLTPISYGLRIKYISFKDLTINYLKKISDQDSQYIEDYKQVKSIIENSEFLQRENVFLEFYNEKSEKTKYYKELIVPPNQIMNFNNPELEALIQTSSILWTSNYILILVDSIISDKLWENNKEGENTTKPSYYYIILACTKNTNYVNLNNIQKMFENVNKFYQDNPELKTLSCNNHSTLVDETFVINEDNKENKDEIIHPNSTFQLLPSSLKNTSFINPIKIITGSNWKQLFFEPIKVKTYFTALYYY